MKIHTDFREFIRILNKNDVEYVIVGAFALAFHGYPRATGDMDVWIRPLESNAVRLLMALSDFGFKDLKLKQKDILSGKIIQLGYPPVRIDLVTVLDGLNSDDIWDTRVSGKFGDVSVSYIGRAAFIKNKRALGRHKDLADLELLGEKV
ncbi:MAG: hypothetical protein NTV99_08755 [Deltaproteobacteria bacterium]|nr:hypothetical protein [Deltaproteobacteria bacterium]